MFSILQLKLRFWWLWNSRRVKGLEALHKAHFAISCVDFGSLGVQELSNLQMAVFTSKVKGGFSLNIKQINQLYRPLQASLQKGTTQEAIN